MTDEKVFLLAWPSSILRIYTFNSAVWSSNISMNTRITKILQRMCLNYYRMCDHIINFLCHTVNDDKISDPFNKFFRPFENGLTWRFAFYTYYLFLYKTAHCKKGKQLVSNIIETMKENILWCPSEGPKLPVA